MSTLSLIAAVARNGAIGKGNDLLWSNPLDQKHFRATTMGCPVIMGRRTWDSLPARFRPLPGRRNVVLTRDSQWKSGGAESAASLDAALELLQDEARIFVIGGGQIYAEALPLANELVLTELNVDLDGDTFFPPWSREQFKEIEREVHQNPSPQAFEFAFVKYRRIA